MSVLDGDTFKRLGAKFPESEKDVKVLFKMIMDTIHNPEIQKQFIKTIQGNPKQTPLIVSKFAAMIAHKVMATLKSEEQVEMGQKNVLGMMMVIVTELYTLVERLGGPEPNKDTIGETARMAFKDLDQFQGMEEGEQGEQQGGQQAPQGPPQQAPQQAPPQGVM